MSDLKLVLTDLDGTVAPHARHEISDAVRQAIIDVENKGIVVAAVTGRPYDFSKQALNVLGISGLCVVDGGATIVDTQTEEIVWKQWLSAARTKAIIEAILPYSDAIIYTTGVNILDADMIDTNLITEDTANIFALIDPTKEHDLVQELDAIEGIDYYVLDGVHPFTFEPHRAVQINDHQATKHHGVEALREILHIPIEQTLAIGDGDNDIALFRSAAIKVAMGNATEGLKKNADFITATLNEDGFVQAMQKYILND